MTDRKQWVRWALYAVELLFLFMLQEIPDLLPRIMGAKPVLVLAAIQTMAMREENIPAMFVGLFAGLLCDFGGGSPMGYHALVFALLCFLLSSLCGTRMQVHLYTCVMMGIWTIAVAVVLDWLLLYMAAGYSLPGYALCNAYLPVYFYTLLMIPVCYGLQKLVFRFFGRYGI